MERVAYKRPFLPVLHACDVTVVGGPLAGVAAALGLAKAGWKVALVEPRTYLGRDVFATLRPWLRVPAGADPRDLPWPIPACMQASGTSAEKGEVALHPDAVKIRLEDLLLGAGVRLIYASAPVGLCAQASLLEGLIIGNKSGRQVVACRTVVDATETALVSRLAEAEFEPTPDGTFPYSTTLEFEQVALADDIVEFRVPEGLAAVRNRVTVHRGYRGCGHVLVECQFALPRRADSAVDLTRREVAARKKAVDVASFLLHRVEAFRTGYLATVAHELHGPCTSRLAGAAPAWVLPLGGLTVALPGGPIPISAFAGPVAGLWCLDEAARTDGFWSDPVAATALAGSFARTLGEQGPAPATPAGEPRPVRPAAPAGRLEVREPDQPQRGRRYTSQAVAPRPLPVLCDVDVLTVGGGSSGAVAAIAAAGEGVRTFVVDMNPGLGGTGTYGGVDSYWIGWRDGFCKQVSAWVDQIHDHIRHPRLHGIVPPWSIEAKTHAFLQQAGKVGAEMLFNATVIGAIVEGTTVRGVVAATRLGPVVLLGKVVVDSTGDGDVAAFAGAEYVYGAERDYSTMWYSLPQIRVPGRTRNNFTSPVDVTNIEDYTRAVLSARRRGQIGRDHDHGVYVATRESRHIRGDVLETLTDQLLLRAWPDVVNIAVSNNDIKGQIDSDWFRMGMIPPQIEIEMPYRALLPRGLQNILVTGKAVSATHDALPAIRMQPDFENMGGAAGLAAAMAVRAGKPPRAVDLRALQERLVQMGVLPERVLRRQLVPRACSDAELAGLVDAIVADDRPLHSYSNQELVEVYRAEIPLVLVCCAGPQAIPLLEKALARAEGSARLRLAQALSIMGSTAGVPALVSALEHKLAEGHLPRRTAFIQQVDEWAPDQSAMPEAAYLLYSLGMARDRRALPIWRRVVDLLAAAMEEDVWSQAKGIFYYVDAVCYGAERLGDPEAIPILRQLHGYAPFHGRQTVEGFQVNYFLERPAYLEVVIGRALARCGSPEGIAILINYLNDVRSLLAEQAYTEVIAITGQDHGRDVASWSHWLEREAGSLKPMPRTGPTDAMAAWEEQTLTAVPEAGTNS